MVREAWTSYIRMYRGSYLRFVGGALLAVGQALALLPIPLLFKHAFDQVIPTRDGFGLLLVGAAVIALQSTSSMLGVAARYTVLDVVKRAILSLRERLLQQLYRLPRSTEVAFDRAHLYEILVHDTERIDVMTNALAAHVLPAALLACGISAILVALDWRLFMVALAIFPVAWGANRWLKPRLTRRIEAAHDAFERFSRGTLRVLDAMDLTRIQGAEAYETVRQRRLLDELRLRTRASGWLQSVYSFSQSTIVGAGAVAVLVAGGTSVAAGEMSLGVLLSFCAGLALLRQPAYVTMVALPQLIEGNRAVKRVMRFERDTAATVHRTTRIRFAGRIELRGVHFGFDGRPLLRGIDLTLEPGRIVSVSGPNGAGKSTMAMLILGFNVPQQGMILVDGHDLQDLDLTSLRSQIGVLQQEPFILRGTIWENLTYGQPDADPATVRAAARAAAADEFIDRLPAGYDTALGEGGSPLSGGQKQRLALARALIRRSRLLILDEPTNHIDHTVMIGILERLRSVPEPPTVLVLTHDAGLADHADAAWWLSDGIVVPYRVQGLGIGDQGSGIRASGIGVQRAGVGIQGAGLGAQGSEIGDRS